MTDDKHSLASTPSAVASEQPTDDEVPAQPRLATPSVKPEEKSRIVSRLQRIPHEWLTKEPPPQRWLLKDGETGHGVLPYGVAGALVGAGGVSKTFAALDLVICVAAGSDRLWWLDRYKVFEPGHVCILVAETNVESARRRLYRLAKHSELTDDEVSNIMDRVRIAPLDGCAGLGNELGPVATQLAAEGVEWRLIVLDPLSRFAEKETESTNDGATRFVAVMEQFSQLPGRPNVLLTHHTPQSSRDSGSARGRGVTGLHDGFRWVATLTDVSTPKNPDLVEFAVTKSNEGPTSPRIPIHTLKREDGLLRPATEAEKTVARAERDAIREMKATVKADEIEEKIKDAVAARGPEITSADKLYGIIKGPRNETLDVIRRLRPAPLHIDAKTGATWEAAVIALPVPKEDE